MVRERVAVEVDDRVQQFDLTVEPLAGDASSEPLFVVSFSDRGPLLSADEAARTGNGPRSHVAADELERELRDTRERLQA